MTFWCELSEESSKVVKELPPLTEEMLAVFENKFGIKLPRAYVDLLRTKNGGYLENKDFKFRGDEYSVRQILGVLDGEDFWSIRPCTSFLDDPSVSECRKAFEGQAGDLTQLFLFADADHVLYALNYNRLNAQGEPTVVWFVAADEEAVEVKQVADSFAAFMKGHYFGDPEPMVKMEEAEKHTLVAEGGYSGTHEVTGKAVLVSWKICSDLSRVLVFMKEDWGWEISLVRSQLNKSQLVQGTGLLEKLKRMYRKFLLYRLGKAIGANLLQAADSESLSVSKYDVPVKPRCFCLTLGAQTLGGEPSSDPWIRVQTSKAFEGKWKNSESKVWNTSVYSNGIQELEKATDAIVGILI